jgi:hypothetical protein
MVAYKVSSMGYFGGVAKVSRGPWFRDAWVEDDGLDWYYKFKTNDKKDAYLLTNNVQIEDREKLDSLYKTHVRNNRLAWFGGLYLGMEAVRSFHYFKTMASGWRFVSVLGLGYVAHAGLMDYTSQVHAPIIGAYLRKYKNSVKSDLLEIKDAKKAYFVIDDSQYMSYTNATLGDNHHADHGPQPEGEALANTYQQEVDAFLAGEENNLKGHHLYLDYPFEFKDKSFPTTEAVSELFNRV